MFHPRDAELEGPLTLKMMNPAVQNTKRYGQQGWSYKVLSGRQIEKGRQRKYRRSRIATGLDARHKQRQRHKSWRESRLAENRLWGPVVEDKPENFKGKIKTSFNAGILELFLKCVSVSFCLLLQEIKFFWGFLDHRSYTIEVVLNTLSVQQNKSFYRHHFQNIYLESVIQSEVSQKEKSILYINACRWV